MWLLEMMKSTCEISWITTAIAIAISPTLLPAPVTAQNITAAPDGTGTVVLPNGQRFEITGGTQAGANLFHSFQQFGLNQGQIANFLSQPNIQNILGRVVGGDPSVINGLIQLTGGNSNLYIMNPAGIIFGANASLNVPAAFTATTANGIQVGNAWFGMNTSASDLKNLTGSPNAFAFTTPTTATQASGVILNQGNLSVPSGNSISLVGGIVINTGTISTPNGKINIVAVPDGKYVRITPEGSALSLDLPITTQQELGNAKPMTVVNLPSLLTGTGIAAPTQAGTAIVSGNLTANGIDILANRYDTSQANLNAANIQQGWNFVFIDSTVKNYQTLLDGTKGGSSITVINPDQYGLAQVTKTLASVTGANSLHIVSEGDKGSFWLGKDFVNNDRLGLYISDFSAWKMALSPAAEVLLYACNLAGDVSGQALVQRISQLTGAPVAASIDRTGGVLSNANWNLEYSTGAIRPQTIFTAATMQSYENALATLTVQNNLDAGALSLRQSIIDAVAGDTIAFDPSVTLITLTTGTLNINKNLTINGGGTVEVNQTDASGERTFDISGAGTVANIDALTISGNATNATNTFDSVGNLFSGGGGGIQVNAGTTLNLSNSRVQNNYNPGNGGGILNFGTAFLRNVTVDGNASNTDGGNNGAGAGIYNNNGGTLSIIDSTISNNRSFGRNGTLGGGGVFNLGTLTVTNSTISGNTAIRNGAGIYNNGTATITNSAISGNTPDTIVANAPNTNGGGIENTGTLTITNSTVSGNSSINDGGGIANFGTTTLTNVTVRNNTAGDDGGGIVNFGTLNIFNSTLSNNTALSASSVNSGGGSLLNTIGATATLTNTTVSGNTALNGGGIRNDGNLTLTNTTVTDNRATGGFGGGGIANSVGALTIRNTILAGNIDTSGNNRVDLGNAGTVTDAGNNLIGNTANIGIPVTFAASTLLNVDPKLAPLGNYGGTTQTHALLPDSLALNAGAFATATDQRGATRIVGSAVDIGAFESQGFSLTPLANTTPQSTNVNTSFAQLLGVQVTENFVNSPIPAANIPVTFAPPSSSSSGAFAGNASVLTNNLGIAIAPTFTANGVSGSYTVAATATNFTTASFSLTNAALPVTPVTNKVVTGFGGVFPSREDREGHIPKLDEQDVEDVSFTQVLCLDAAIATPQTTSIPTCKEEERSQIK
jgi:filamentous hemagglutinin family protein